jgi:hypothetical protein
MNLKTFTSVMAGVCLLSSAAFGQIVSLTGTVTGVTHDQITLKSGKDTWAIRRRTTTVVTSGNLTVGATLTVQYAKPDGEKVQPSSSSPTKQ